MSTLHILAATAAAGTGASIAYCGLCIYAGAKFISRKKRVLNPVHLPPVSILKPLKGADPELYQALRSHCLQDYPDYEILFGIADPGDPAAEIVAKLVHEFPDRKIRLLTSAQSLGANGKVSNLIQLVSAANNEFLLVNDSDIRVPPDYLRTTMALLQQPGTGLVTCLYRGVAAATIPSRLEALGISTDFAAGVLAAWQIERGLHFALGSTLAFRRRELEAIGGFQTLADYLADDYELGRRIAELNLKVELSDLVVETHLPAYDWGAFFSHQLRWARTIRVSRPGGYAGLLFTFALPWAIAVLGFARAAPWACYLAGAALLVRYAMAVVVGKLVVRDSSGLPWLWLLPVRDFIAAGIWLGGFFGRKIVWRGQSFYLKQGRMVPSK